MSVADSNDADVRGAAGPRWHLPAPWHRSVTAVPTIGVLWLVGAIAALKVWFELLAGRLPMVPAGFAGSAAQVMLWGTVAALAVVAYRRLEGDGASDDLRMLTAVGMLGALAYGLVVWLVGRRFGAAANPLAGHPLYLVSLAAAVTATETARTLAVRRWVPRAGALAFIAITLAFGLLAVPIAKLLVFGDPAQAFRSIGASILPALAVSAVATQLAELGGLLPALAYRGTLVAVTALVVVPAAAPWPIMMLVGTYAPAAVLMLLAAAADVDAEADPAVADGPDAGGAAPSAGTSWRRRLVVDGSAAAVAVLLVVFLSRGLFGFHATVTSGVSMEPHFHEGDLLIVRDAPFHDLARGQIVEVQHGDQVFVHRIVRLQNTAAGTLVTTRGDNNPQPDEPATASRVRGRVVARLPGLGRLRMFFRWLAG